MIAGLLPSLARDLNVGLAATGHLVTAFSLAYAIGAPVMAVLTAGLAAAPPAGRRHRRLRSRQPARRAGAGLCWAVGRAAAAGTVRSDLHAGRKWILSGKRTDEHGHAGAALLRLLDEHPQEEKIWKGFAATVRSKNRPNGETHNG